MEKCARCSQKTKTGSRCKRLASCKIGCKDFCFQHALSYSKTGKVCKVSSSSSKAKSKIYTLNVGGFDLELSQLDSKTIHVAMPEYEENIVLPSGLSVDFQLRLRSWGLTPDAVQTIFTYMNMPAKWSPHRYINPITGDFYDPKPRLKKKSSL